LRLGYPHIWARAPTVPFVYNFRRSSDRLYAFGRRDWSSSKTLHDFAGKWLPGVRRGRGWLCRRLGACGTSGRTNSTKGSF